jgi:hypothetical protein
MAGVENIPERGSATFPYNSWWLALSHQTAEDPRVIKQVGRTHHHLPALTIGLIHQQDRHDVHA